jgi:transposase
LEGLLWLLRTGARWQDIPADLPSGSTCWRRLREWAREGILEDIQAVLVEQLAELGRVDLSELFADATFIRAKKGATTSVKPRLAKG